MQEVLYLAKDADLLTMSGEKQSPWAQAREGAAVTVGLLRKEAGVSQDQLHAKVKLRGGKVSQKTISNVERGEHDSQIGTYNAIAEYFGIPIWVLFLPGGLPKDLIAADRLKRLVRLVDDYLGCSDEQRQQIDGVATGYAGLHKKR